jgi:hypothetical protein
MTVTSSLIFVRERVESSLVHRVDRVLSFLSSRQNSNWDSPTPSHAGQWQCAPPPFWFRREAHLLTGEGSGRADPILTDTVVLKVYVYLLSGLV